MLDWGEGATGESSQAEQGASSGIAHLKELKQQADHLYKQGSIADALGGMSSPPTGLRLTRGLVVEMYEAALTGATELPSTSELTELVAPQPPHSPGAVA